MKQQALEQVANEFEVLEKDKGEIQQWISDVKKELSTTADQEDQNPEVVVRRRKLKVSSLENMKRLLTKYQLKQIGCRLIDLFWAQFCEPHLFF